MPDKPQFDPSKPFRKGPELSQGRDVPLANRNPLDSLFAMKDSGVSDGFGIDDILTFLTPANVGKASLAIAPLIGKLERGGLAALDKVRREAKVAEAALDMSKVAREARAAEMGFAEKELFHATQGNFAEFSQQKAGRNYDNPAKGFFFTDNPNAANSFIDDSYGKVHIPKPGTIADRFEQVKREVRTKELTQTKLVNPEFGFAEEVKKDGLTKAESAVADEYFSLLKKQSELGYDQWREMHDVMETVPGANMVKARVRYSNPKTVDVSGRGDINLHPMIEQAKAEGHDAVIFKGAADNPGKSVYGRHQAGQTVVVFEPNQIRSVNAAFDPAKKNSANILAGAAGAAVAAGSIQKPAFDPSKPYEAKQ
jgi:hypothetical protein